MFASISGIQWKRGIRRGWIELMRERGWAATFGAMLGILFLGQLLLFLMLGVQGVQQQLRTRTDFRLELKSGATDQQMQEFYTAVRAQPYVERAVYITKEKAYEEERKRDPNLIQFLEQFQLRNPFPDTVGVTLRSLDRYEDFASFTRQPQWKNVVDPAYLSKVTDQEKQAHELLSIALSLRAMIALFLVLISTVLLLVLIALVQGRFESRREEVIVERLAGAEETAVLLPFVTETSLLLFGSLLFATLLFAVVLTVLPAVIPSLAFDGSFGNLATQVMALVQRASPGILGLEVLLIPVAAYIGTWFGVGRGVEL